MSDVDVGFDVITLVAMVLEASRAANEGPTPQHDSILTGQLYYAELLATNNPNRFLNVARMDKPTFLSLLHLLKTEGGLENSMFLEAGIKLLMFIHVLTGQSNRQIAERWQHSGSTVSLAIHEVAASILACKEHFFKVPKEGDPVQDYIAANDKFRPYFGNCIGALDGTHVMAIVPNEEHGVFRNRKKTISQNVLAVTNFDLTFSYALCGWEGSAHDSRVLDDSRNRGLPVFPGKFYLADGGYALSSTVLTPYRGTRYHLNEWALGNRKPQNARELFNLRHSSLRNAIERIFGVVKRRFPILVVMKPFDFLFQCDIVMCALMLHNFIQLNQLYEDYFYDDVVDAAQEFEPNGDVEVVGNANALYQWRNGIANAMWDDYVAHNMNLNP